MAGELKPKARDGLLTSDHSKRGRRYVIVLDPAAHQTTLLDPWEHAILLLCDGTRDAVQISKLLGPVVEGEPVDLRAVQRSLKLFERERLVESFAREPAVVPPSTNTLAELQVAFREWHKEPVVGGHSMQFFPGLLTPPFGIQNPPQRGAFEPTVALPEEPLEDRRRPQIRVGSTLVLADADDVLSTRGPIEPAPAKNEPRTVISPPVKEASPPVAERAAPKDAKRGAGREVAPVATSVDEFEPELFDVHQDVAQLLEAVDHEFLEVESREAKQAAESTKPSPPPVMRAYGGETIPPESREMRRPVAKVLTAPASEAELIKNVDVVGFRPLAERETEERRAPPPKLATASARPLEPAPADAATVMLEAGPPFFDHETQRPLKGIEDEATARVPAVDSIPEISASALIADLTPVDGPTEAGLSAASPADIIDRAPASRRAADEPGPPTLRSRSGMSGTKKRASKPRSGSSKRRGSARAASRMPADSTLPARVFERLRRAGLRARGDGDAEPPRETDDRRARRRDGDHARAFDLALRSVTSGDLDLALRHFRHLFERMPESQRLAAFINAIEGVQTGQEEGGNPSNALTVPPGGAENIFDSFERVLEEAVAYGRCPACFSMVERNFTTCFACGFTLGRP